MGGGFEQPTPPGYATTVASPVTPPERGIHSSKQPSALRFFSLSGQLLTELLLLVLHRTDSRSNIRLSCKLVIELQQAFEDLGIADLRQRSARRQDGCV